MMRSILLLLVVLLTGCQSTMVAFTPDQSEVIQLSYDDIETVKTIIIQGNSTTGEYFSGSLDWTKSSGSFGHLKGNLVGENGSVLEVKVGCNMFVRECAGTATDETGKRFFVF